MSKYIININKQDSESGSNYEVHELNTCTRLPLPKNQVLLGDFSNCHWAIQEAKRRWPSEQNNIDGCYYCCEDCHSE